MSETECNQRQKIWCVTWPCSTVARRKVRTRGKTGKAAKCSCHHTGCCTPAAGCRQHNGFQVHLPQAVRAQVMQRRTASTPQVQPRSSTAGVHWGCNKRWGSLPSQVWDSSDRQPADAGHSATCTHRQCNPRPPTCTQDPHTDWNVPRHLQTTPTVAVPAQNWRVPAAMALHGPASLSVLRDPLQWPAAGGARAALTTPDIS